MITKFIEATDETQFNWGKFAVCRFDQEEWMRPSSIGLNHSLLSQRGWSPEHIWVLDLETGEGIWVRPGGCAVADLDQKSIWCCPMYLPFLEWLYKQDLTDILLLPSMVNLGKVPTSMQGYRREGKKKWLDQAVSYITRLAKIANMTPQQYLNFIEKHD